MKEKDSMDNDNDSSFYLCQTVYQVCYITNHSKTQWL